MSLDQLKRNTIVDETGNTAEIHEILQLQCEQTGLLIEDGGALLQRICLTFQFTMRSLTPISKTWFNIPSAGQFCLFCLLSSQLKFDFLHFAQKTRKYFRNFCRRNLFSGLVACLSIASSKTGTSPSATRHIKNH